MPKLTWEQVYRRRLARSQPLAPAAGSQLAGIDGKVCGIQAQLSGAAELRVEAFVQLSAQQQQQQQLEAEAVRIGQFSLWVRRRGSYWGP